VSDRDRNAKVIIPFVLAVWLGGILVTREGTPEAVRLLFAVAFVVSVPVIVFSLISRGGWDTLAARYPAPQPYRGAWRAYPTAVISRASLDDPGFRSQQVRFIGGTLRAAATPDALHLSTLLARLPGFGALFPEVQVPWSEVRRARVYDAPGWYAPQRDPGVLLQAAYDPNYTGKFVDLAIGDPAVYVQLPAELIGEPVLSKLPATFGS